jgi:NaMN:DMB phosphoribosyltransferase
VHARALADLRLQPVLDLNTACGDGTAGLLALDLLAGAATAAGAAAAAAVAVAADADASALTA